MSRTLFKTTSLVSVMTLISRLLGFARDMIAAQLFGVNAATDAFNVAFKIPNFMRNLFAENSFSQAFVPVLSEYKETRPHNQVRIFISHLLAGLSLVLFIISLLGMWRAQNVISLFAPGLDPYRYQLATEMLRITFPYLMLISLTAFAGATLNTYEKFGIQAFTPALLNVCLIVTAYGLSSHFHVPIMSQAWGVLIAGFVQLIFQIPFLARNNLLVMPSLNWRDEGVRKVLKLMLPAIFGASIGQISLLLNTIFASFLKVGSVTWLYYSDRIAYFPLGVFGVAFATVALPYLSRHFATKSEQQFSSTLDWGVRCNLLIGIPASLSMMLLATPIIISLFYYGKFSVYDVVMTRHSVIAYSLGLQAFMLVKVLTSAFYARQDTRTAVRIGVMAIAINMILNVILIFPLAHAGLALASSLGSWCNTFLLFFVLYRRNIYRFQAGWGKFILRLLFANGVLALFLWWVAGNMNTWLNWHGGQRFLHITLIGIFSVMIYLGCLWICGVRKRDFSARSI